MMKKKLTGIIMAAVMLTSLSLQPAFAEERGGRGGGGGNAGGGMSMTQNSDEIQAVIDGVSEQFEQYTYQDDENGITLEYSLFVPEDYDGQTQYPLLMYIPDSTGSGKSAKELVEQYYGAAIWATEEDQSKHAAFILVPAFSETVVDDNFNVSSQVESAVHLISSLTKDYAIDTNRLYTTGQSMGCMTSLYLNSQYPDLFAASLYVSGQWDISVLENMENQSFFYIVAGGDAKASAGQDEVMNMFSEDQIAYTYAEWDAQADAETQNANAQSLIDQNISANMIRFEAGTVLNGGSGMEHMVSFNYAYAISAVRDWLFAQAK